MRPPQLTYLGKHPKPLSLDIAHTDIVVWKRTQARFDGDHIRRTIREAAIRSRTPIIPS